MALTEAELSAIRSWVGDAVEDAVLDERYDRLGDLDEVVLEQLRHRQAVLINDEPGVFVVDGMTINQADNMRSLDGLIEEFLGAGGLGLDDTPPSGGGGVTQIVRESLR